MGAVKERNAELILVCSDCAGSWAHDWIERWSFTHCPRCAGELHVDRQALSAHWRELAGSAERER